MSSFARRPYFKSAVVSCLILLLVLIWAKAADEKNGDDVLSPSLIVSVMKRANDYQVKSQASSKDRNWIRGTYYTGVMAAYKATGDRKLLEQAMGWAESHRWQVGSENSGGNKLTCVQTYLELYMVKKERAMIEPVITWLDSGKPNSPTGAKVWYLEGGVRYADSLYVGPPALAMLGRITGDRKYFDFMNSFFWDVHAEIFDSEAGLFYRDKRFIGKKTANGKSVYWSRGNGWVVGGIVRILQYLPQDDPSYPKYVQLLKTLVDSIVKVQGSDGLWRPNLGDEAEFAMPETSGTGFFVYAIAWGINSGILDREKYLPVVKKGWAGLTGCVNEEGRVEWGQLVGDRPAAVKKENTQEYVTGAFLLAGSEMYRLAGGKVE